MSENFGGIFAKPNVPSCGSGIVPTLPKSLWYKSTAKIPVKRLNKCFSATHDRKPIPNGKYVWGRIFDASSPSQRVTSNLMGCFHATE